MTLTGFLRNGCKSYLSYHSLLHRHSAPGSPILRSHRHCSKPLSRLPPNPINRKTGLLELFSPPPATIFRSSFSSSAAAAVSSSSKIGFVGWYLAMVKSRPILTKSATCALIYTAADFSSQTITQPSSEPYDYVRTLRMAGYGLIILGPSLHFWFNFMSKVLPNRDLITTLKKIVLGQTLYGPAMVSVFFSVNAVLQGENGAEIIARLKRDLLPTLMMGVMYWPVCDFVTFRFIPVHLQPLASNTCSYLWTIYTTYMASSEKARTSSYHNI
ncbi:uncharacterized protein LOC127800668 [Diospyros lotus]|uniref:uncharacterized protein LOC127800668 n=1 Tax=Diospyros lotus TaxID=55363 RepID=UPI00225A689A|nr:uncharacterized protein LOC127800668 [Diospyros lotus]